MVQIDRGLLKKIKGD